MLIYRKTPDPLKVIIHNSNDIFLNKEIEKDFIKKYINEDIKMYMAGRGMALSINDFINMYTKSGGLRILEKHELRIFIKLLDTLTAVVLARHTDTQGNGIPHLLDYNESAMIYGI